MSCQCVLEKSITVLALEFLDGYLTSYFYLAIPQAHSHTADGRVLDFGPFPVSGYDIVCLIRMGEAHVIVVIITVHSAIRLVWIVKISVMADSRF